MNVGQPERPRGRRADAERNADRIIRSARVVFAREGLGASMASIAREAGVGKATVARHFASPQTLIDAVFADRMEAYAEATREALAKADPWEAFVDYVWTIAGMQATDRGFADLMTLSLPMADSLEALRLTAYRGFVELIARAQRAGRLCQDFVSEDLVVLLMANAGVLSATATGAPESWRRLVGQLLRAYEAPPPELLADCASVLAPLAPAPTSEDLYRAMARVVPSEPPI